MSYSNTCLDHRLCDADSVKYKQKHTKPKKILLECGDGTGSRTFTSSSESSFQLAHVTLDQTPSDKAEILIKFSSIVKMERLIDGATVRLQYELFRLCDEKKSESLGSWMFEEIGVVDNTFDVQEESFSFIFCDYKTCPGCCDYFVTVRPIEIDGALATVDNGRIAALFQTSYFCVEDEYETKCKQKHSQPQDILLACGTGNGSIILREESQIEPPFVIAHATLDTSFLRMPGALIEFSSIIKIDNEVNSVRLQFELFKVCDDGKASSRGVWTFERSGNTDRVELEKVFDFTFCECETISGCCEYFVMVTPLGIDIAGIDSDIVVDNARMVVIGQSPGDTCKSKRHDGKNDYMDCVPKDITTKKVVLKCGEGNRSRTFRSSIESPFQLAEVTIDTKYLCKPLVNIEFSSIVSFDRLAIGGDARLRYELFRICDKKSPVSLGVWVMERVDNEAVQRKSTNIFNFTFCDCISCPGLCKYFVAVTPIQITEGLITATVSNGGIAALDQGVYCNHCYMNNNYFEASKSLNKCKAKHPKPQLLLECGEGTGNNTFTSSSNTTLQLAHVTLEATCLTRTQVLIKFSSIVSVRRLIDEATVRLQYELFRVGDDRKPESLGNWIFEEVNVMTNGFDKQEESFSFIFCDCKPCQGCCDYFIAVTPIEIEGAAATVGNGRMSALSKSLCDSVKDEDKIYNTKTEVTKFKQKHLNPKETLLACGQGNGSVVFRENNAETNRLDPSVAIAHVNLDMSFLAKPKVQIEFSSMIEIEDGVEDIRLQFELFRVCDGGGPLSRGTWNFERTNVNELIELTKPFDFIFCELEVPSKCCEYFVTVKPLEIDIDSPGGDVVVNNARIVAIGQSTKSLDNCRTLDKKNDCIDCVTNHHQASQMVLECGDGTGNRSFTSGNEPAFQLARVNIDTTCLCNPMVNIEFSSIVSFNGSGNGRLRYELFRVCNGREPISLGIWISERIRISLFDRTTNIFNFTFCDCITCPGCCDYFVKVTPIFISSGLTVTVSNGRIAVLAQER